MQTRIGIDQIVEAIGGEVVVFGDTERIVTAALPLDEAGSGCVAFCSKKGGAGLEAVRVSKAGVVICHGDLPLGDQDFGKRTVVLVQNPRLAFIKVMERYFKPESGYGVSPSAIIDVDAVLGGSVYVGPHTYLGRCQIGENTMIHGNVHVYPDVVIGRNVVIQAGTVIGAEGQGFERDDLGVLRRFPQVGGVRVGDDVEIGSGVGIMRGAFRNTEIGDGTKIGHLCSVGHNAVIGKHCLIITHSTIGGSCRIGDYSQVSLGACVRNGVSVGNNCVVGMGAVVTEDVGDGKVVFGVPARERATRRM